MNSQIVQSHQRIDDLLRRLRALQLPTNSKHCQSKSEEDE